jgi:hypothetical protein
MKVKVSVLITASVAVACIIVCLTRSPQSEVLVSSGIALTPQWQEIRPAASLWTNAAWSEFLLEMPSQHFRQIGNQVLLGDGTDLHIEVYAVTEADEKVDFNRVEVVRYGPETFLRLSSARLEWKQRDYRFRIVALRSDRPLQTGKIIWMSYDPRATKDGVVFPRALR